MKAKTMQTVTVLKTYAGNLAIEQDTFTLPNAVAKALRTYLKANDLYAYEYTRINRHVLRAKGGDVTLYSAGFGTSELSNQIYAAMPEGAVEVVVTIDEATDQRGRR